MNSHDSNEPVAWRHWHGEENGGWEYYEEASCADCQPLYTYPPFSVQPEKEERRPLSDEQIVQALRGACEWPVKDEYKALARAIEAAHEIGISHSPSMVGREDTTNG